MSRNTLQRQIILDALRAHGQHPTADDIYNHISKTHPSISKATVYRNLASSVDNGEIAATGVFGGAMHFDHRVEEHFHFVCEDCNTLIDISKQSVNMQHHIQQLQINKIELTFKGICTQCQHANESTTETSTSMDKQSQSTLATIARVD
ncbi:MAG: transcriptional repressor [Clostridiales bacterium]|jgi:Fe2+ or Zn2+ uptake regulation protein|nr:transcriptional repressor [Clostridiales bacterium]